MNSQLAHFSSLCEYICQSCFVPICQDCHQLVESLTQIGQKRLRYQHLPLLPVPPTPRQRVQFTSHPAPHIRPMGRPPQRGNSIHKHCHSDVLPPLHDKPDSTKLLIIRKSTQFTTSPQYAFNKACIVKIATAALCSQTSSALVPAMQQFFVKLVKALRWWSDQVPTSTFVRYSP